jgi:hypothetical protein
MPGRTANRQTQIPRGALKIGKQTIAREMPNIGNHTTP